MPRSCIGEGLCGDLSDTTNCSKIAYMRGSDSDDIEPQKRHYTPNRSNQTRAIHPIKLLP